MNNAQALFGESGVRPRSAANRWFARFNWRSVYAMSSSSTGMSSSVLDFSACRVSHVVSRYCFVVRSPGRRDPVVSSSSILQRHSLVSVANSLPHHRRRDGRKAEPAYLRHLKSLLVIISEWFDRFNSTCLRAERHHNRTPRRLKHPRHGMFRMLFVEHHEQRDFVADTLVGKNLAYLRIYGVAIELSPSKC